MDPLDTFETTSRKTGHRWADFIVGGSAILIAVVSLAVALRQSQIMERQLAASTWPVLQYDTGNQSDDGKQVVNFDLKNAGVGPARIHSVTLLFDGKPVMNPLELVEACCADLLSTGQRPNWLTNFVSDRVLTPNEKVHFLVLIDSEANLPYWKRLDSARNKVVLQACYCSVLDDCWMLDSSRNQPEPIAACPAKQATDYQG